MAMASDLVTADCVEAQEFMDLSRAFGVSAVPKTIINDKEEILGSMPEEVFLESVLKAGSAPAV
jgi:predicted DsbA family dithiol-disulfide isomerase